MPLGDKVSVHNKVSAYVQSSGLGHEEFKDE